VGWLWFLVTLVPVIGIIQVGGQSMADRYTYIPFIGIFIMCVWGVSGLIKRVPYGRILLACAGSGILIYLSIVTWFQVGHWQDSKTIFRHAISVTNRNHVAHSSLGTAFLDEDRLDEAVAEYKKALVIWPSYPDGLNNLGVAYGRKGMVKEAIDHLNRAIDICPDCPEARNNLGRVLMLNGDLEGAIEQLERAIELRPDYAEAHNNLGLVFLQLGALEEAIYHLASALHFKPDYAKARTNLRRAVYSLRPEKSNIKLPLP